MDVATYQEKHYEPADKPCWSLVADVLFIECGVVVDICTTVTGSIRAAAAAFRLELHKGAHGFQQIDEPVDFAVVLMAKTVKVGIHHCGIYYQGSVLHALESGTLYQDLPSLREEYQIMEFWSL
jgi:hypothetical protein